jgi:hypothetical protein
LDLMQKRALPDRSAALFSGGQQQRVAMVGSRLSDTEHRAPVRTNVERNTVRVAPPAVRSKSQPA